MIVVFGSINLDTFFHLRELPQPGQTLLARSASTEAGGKGANQALAAALDGANVIMVGAVGNDAHAAAALANLGTAGVDMQRVLSLPTTTGCATLFVDDEGRNMIAVAAGANALAHSNQIEDALLGPATTLLLQMENDPGQTAALIYRARRQGTRIVLNLAPAAELPDAALRCVDLLVVNETEARWLATHLGTEADAQSLHGRLGVGVVRTLGAAGAEAAAAGEHIAIPAHRVPVIDSAAAGDCFIGVLSASLERGSSLTEALRRANAAAALCCTRPGSQCSLPTRQQIDSANP